MDRLYIWSNNSFGSDSNIISMRVVPAYDYGNNTLVLTSKPNHVDSFSNYHWRFVPQCFDNSNPASGIVFEPSNGSIWGTPTINQTAQIYTIAVSNSSGSDAIVLSIAIGEIAPITAYDTSNVTLVRGFNITEFTTAKPEEMSSLSKQILHCRKGSCVFFVNKQRFD